MADDNSITINALVQGARFVSLTSAGGAGTAAASAAEVLAPFLQDLAQAAKTSISSSTDSEGGGSSSDDDEDSEGDNSPLGRASNFVKERLSELGESVGLVKKLSSALKNGDKVVDGSTGDEIEGPQIKELISQTIDKIGEVATGLVQSEEFERVFGADSDIGNFIENLFGKESEQLAEVEVNAQVDLGAYAAEGDAAQSVVKTADRDLGSAIGALESGINSLQNEASAIAASTKIVAANPAGDTPRLSSGDQVQAALNNVLGSGAKALFDAVGSKGLTSSFARVLPILQSDGGILSGGGRLGVGGGGIRFG